MTIFRAHHLKEIEAKFKASLNAAGRQFKASAGAFEGMINLTSNDGSTYFYKEAHKKTHIAQHLTHGVLHGDLWSLSQPNNHVSTSYVIARDGTIYCLFPDQYYAYHLGSMSAISNKEWSRKSIGIETSCLGPLVEDKTNPNILLDTYGKAYCTRADTQFYKACNYRGYKFFATLTDEQYEATNKLVKHLCEKHKIVFSKLPTEKAFDLLPGSPTTTYFFHSNVRKDKVDCSPVFEIDRITGI